MYDIRQFRPVLYAIVMIGITGFAVAAEAPGLWVLSMSAVLLNVWLVRTGRFTPLPRLVANLVTLLALGYAFIVWNRGEVTPILIVGQFLVLLQIVKLFEQRGNRDYAQLLMLSLLLMIAGGISTSTLLFGLLFIAHLFLSLYGCLLFHLKVESDHAKATMGLSEEKINPMTLKQDQRYLGRSMRRLTVLVAMVSVAAAVVVFLFFPRNTGAGLLSPLQFRPRQVLSGFSNEMNFQEIAQITQNTRIVAYVKMWQDGKPIQGSRPLLLRGATVDIYTGRDPNSVLWQWKRAPGGSGEEVLYDPLDSANPVRLNSTDTASTIRQEITLDPTGTDALFALRGVLSFRLLSSSTTEAKLHYHQRDRTLRLEPIPDRRVVYEVVSTDVAEKESESFVRRIFNRAVEADKQALRGGGRPAERTIRPIDRPLMRSVIDPQIEEYARRAEVSGSDAEGPLAARRAKGDFVSPLDEQIAANIERHLLGEGFRYTLDLADAAGIGDQDPMVAFLYRLKRGHCEYFAGAMALMCQSLGLQARVVIGFRSDEYNAMTASYVVRQSHAHTWVEVLNDKSQWVVFDPTSGRTSGATARDNAVWRRLAQFFDFLEYTWARSVVAYDRDTRSNIITHVDAQLSDVVGTGSAALAKARRWFDWGDRFDPLSRAVFWSNFWSKLITFIIAGVMLALVAAITWYLLERWRLRRRARRIGLIAMSWQDQLRMARQLGFYDELIRLLARHRILRAANQTPMEFSRSVSFLPHEIFELVRRLTGIFYRVRYGEQELTATQQRRLKSVIARIDGALSRN